MNWKVFCVVGLLWSLMWAGIAFSKGNITSAKFQLVVVAIYGAALSYQLLKAKKNV